MTAPVVNAAATRFTTVTALDQQLVAQARAEWYRLQLGDLQGSFVDTFLPAVRPGLVQAQAAAARLGAASMAEMTGTDVAVNAAGFAGVASSGAPLGGVLAGPLVGLYVDLEHGVPADDALRRGENSMERILVTQVQDAARAAEQVQLTTARTVHFYVRMTEPGACSRCLILAGKRYRWNADFLRHEHCRCFCAIESEQTDVLKSPQAVFDEMSQSERYAAFGVANTKAIEDGADIYRVVNATGARSGMGTTITDGYGNTYKATRNGARKGTPRLVPQSIYQLAGGDRAEAIRLLQLHGYLR